MIIDFNRYNGGGGSTSGVTPEQVEEQIQSALTPYWESGETKDYVDEAVSGISLDGYWTSAETQSAITAVEDHLYDVEQVTASALTELHDGLMEVSGRTVDLSPYYTSAETVAYVEEYVDSAMTSVQDAIDVIDNVVSEAILDLKSGATELEARVDENEEVTAASLTDLENKINTIDEVISAAVLDLNEKKVSSSSISTIWKGTQAEYDAITSKDPATFYIIINS